MRFVSIPLHAIVFAVATAALGTGCQVRVVERPRPAAAVVEYEPLYYHDYVVYYDDAGLPYYWLDGRVVHVSSVDPEYGVLVRHYRAHGAAYHRWYRVHGRYHYVKREHWVHRPAHER